MVTELTICIPSYNRASQLAVTLNCIAKSLEDYSGQEIDALVLLDGSTDNSQDTVSKMARDFPITLRYEWQTNSGLATARNRLVTLAQGKLIWLLDDDMLISKETLNHHLSADRNLHPVLTGPCVVTGSEGLELFYKERRTRLQGETLLSQPSDMTFANASFVRELLLKYPFNEDFKKYGFEDYELAARLLSVGVPIGYNSSASVTHRHIKSVVNTLKNNFQEGENRVLFSKLHPNHSEIAYNLSPRKYRSILKHLTNFGMHRLLWGAAIAIYRFNTITGNTSGKLSNLSHDCAIHGGMAKAGGKFKTK